MSPTGSHASSSSDPTTFGVVGCGVTGAALDGAGDPGNAVVLSATVGEGGGGGWDVHATTKASRTVTMLPTERLKPGALTMVLLLVAGDALRPRLGPPVDASIG